MAEPVLDDRWRRSRCELPGRESMTENVRPELPFDDPRLGERFLHHDINGGRRRRGSPFVGKEKFPRGSLPKGEEVLDRDRGLVGQGNVPFLPSFSVQANTPAPFPDLDGVQGQIGDFRASGSSDSCIGNRSQFDASS